MSWGESMADITALQQQVVELDSKLLIFKQLQSKLTAERNKLEAEIAKNQKLIDKQQQEINQLAPLAEVEAIIPAPPSPPPPPPPTFGQKSNSQTAKTSPKTLSEALKEKPPLKQVSSPDDSKNEQSEAPKKIVGYMYKYDPEWIPEDKQEIESSPPIYEGEESDFLSKETFVVEGKTYFKWNGQERATSGDSFKELAENLSNLTVKKEAGSQALPTKAAPTQDTLLQQQIAAKQQEMNTLLAEIMQFNYSASSPDAGEYKALLEVIIKQKEILAKQQALLQREKENKLTNEPTAIEEQATPLSPLQAALQAKKGQLKATETNPTVAASSLPESEELSITDLINKNVTARHAAMGHDEEEDDDDEEIVASANVRHSSIKNDSSNVFSMENALRLAAEESKKLTVSPTLVVPPQLNQQLVQLNKLADSNDNLLNLESSPPAPPSVSPVPPLPAAPTSAKAPTVETPAITSKHNITEERPAPPLPPRPAIQPANAAAVNKAPTVETNSAINSMQDITNNTADAANTAPPASASLVKRREEAEKYKAHDENEEALEEIFSADSSITASSVKTQQAEKPIELSKQEKTEEVEKVKEVEEEKLEQATATSTILSNARPAMIGFVFENKTAVPRKNISTVLEQTGTTYAELKTYLQDKDNQEKHNIQSVKEVEVGMLQPKKALAIKFTSTADDSSPCKAYAHENAEAGVTFSVEKKLAGDDLNTTIERICHLAVETAKPTSEFDITAAPADKKEILKQAFEKAILAKYPSDKFTDEQRPKLIDRSAPTKERRAEL